MKPRLSIECRCQADGVPSALRNPPTSGCSAAVVCLDLKRPGDRRSNVTLRHSAFATVRLENPSSIVLRRR